MEKILLTASDLKQLTGLSLPTIYNWFNREDFPTIRIGRKVVCERTAFNRWIEQQASTASKGGKS